MLAVLFWILFSLMLLIVIPDRWHARREIAKATSRFVVLTVRERDLGNGQIQFRKNYVRLSDCRAGYGSLATTDLNGRVLYQNDFILQARQRRFHHRRNPVLPSEGQTMKATLFLSSIVLIAGCAAQPQPPAHKQNGRDGM